MAQMQKASPLSLQNQVRILKSPFGGVAMVAVAQW
jgi:hypothetical protein